MDNLPGIGFGTDGWRGIIGEDFTFSRVELLAQAISNYLNSQTSDLRPQTSDPRPQPSAIVGYDTRHLSKEFAETVARVLASNGISVFLSNSFAPTPALSYAVVEKGAMGAVIITASHNPSNYNGLKFKSASGSSASLEITSAIEEELNRLQIPEPRSQNSDPRLQSSRITHPASPITLFDPQPAYFKRLSELVDLNRVTDSEIEVFLDPMYGATQGYLSSFLRGIGLRVEEIHARIDHSFGGINPEPLPRNLGELSSLLRPQTSDPRLQTSAISHQPRAVNRQPSTMSHQPPAISHQPPTTNREPSTVNREPPTLNYSPFTLHPLPIRVGFAFDGDGDRIGAMDERGNFVSPHQIFALLLKHLANNKGLKGTVIKNFAVTRMVDILAKRYGLPVCETPIGFKYVAELMEKGEVLIGGEESGGFGIQGHIPERDGILCALLILEMMAMEGKPLGRLIEDLERDVGPHRFGRLDLKLYPGSSRDEIIGLLSSSLSIPSRGPVREEGLFPSEFSFQGSSTAPVLPDGFEIEGIKNLDGTKLLFRNGSWLLLRPSGTEPVLRIYAEASSQGEVSRLLAWGKELVSPILLF